MYFNPRSREGSDGLQTVAFAVRRRISIHAPAKGATWQAVRSRRVSHFNPRSREGSDERPAQLWARLRHFNPRSREGSDRIAEPGTYDVASISIHAPAKGATIQPFWTAERSPVFQSTLPRRERRDIPTPKVTPRHEISIHAPAKGATPLASEVKQQLSISIHAPAKGATKQHRSTQPPNSYFNPRSREGSDTTSTSRTMQPSNFNPRSREGSDMDAAELERMHRDISIHAPAKGAT